MFRIPESALILSFITHFFIGSESKQKITQNAGEFIPKSKKTAHYLLLLKWLCIYITNQTQFVSPNGYYSKINVLNFGVPQGFLVGPMLNLIYLNNFSHDTETTVPIFFADDTNLLTSNKDLRRLVENVNNDLKQYLTLFHPGDHINNSCSASVAHLSFFHSYLVCCFVYLIVCTHKYKMLESPS